MNPILIPPRLPNRVFQLDFNRGEALTPNFGNVLVYLKQTDLQRIADSIPFGVRALFRRLGNDLLLAALVAQASNAPIRGYPVAFCVDVIFSGHGLALANNLNLIDDPKQMRRSCDLLSSVR
jgi:hypothetical protein